MRSWLSMLCYLKLRVSDLNLPLGELIDSVKTAAEGVKTHSSTVASWMKNNVSPKLRNILPASPGPPPGEPQPSTSAAAWVGRPVSIEF